MKKKSEKVECPVEGCEGLCYWSTTNPQELRCVKCGEVVDTREDIKDEM